MLRWAENLHCLGQLIEALGFRQDEVLTFEGARIGDIVQDYAAALCNGLEITYHGACNVVETYSSPLHAELTTKLKSIRASKCLSPVDCIVSFTVTGLNLSNSRI